MNTHPHIAIGYINAVQEHHFRVTTTNGHVYLFTLAGNAPMPLNDLSRLRQTHARVCVEYTGEPNLSRGVAHRVQPLAGWQ